MSDEIMNVDPSKDPLTPALNETGAITQKDLVNKQVDFSHKQQEAMLMQEDLKASQEILPLEAKEDLSVQAALEESNNVILVDGEARIVNMQPSSNIHEVPNLEVAIRSGVIGMEQLAAPLPTRFDLRESWWTISDQGATGACVGFGLADGVLRYLFTKSKQLNPGDRLSPRALWTSAKETDEFNEWPTTFIETEGTSLKAALEVSKRWGVINEKLLPFNTLYTKDARSYYRAAAALRILGYYNLGKNIEAWKKWISTTGPILAAINVDSSWQNATQTKGNLDGYNIYSLMGGHAICLCGYTEDRIIIRNSWGTSWGDGGYAYASYDWCMKAIIEAYGVSI